MARIRSIKPEFWTDRAVARKLSMPARLFYIGLWNFADEHGRVNGDALYLKGQIFPYDDLSAEDIDQLIIQLVAAGKAEIYFDGEDPYLFLPNLHKHQRLEPDKVPSRLPEPPAEPPHVPPPNIPAVKPQTEELAQIGADSSESRADSSAPGADESALLYVAGSREQVAGSREEEQEKNVSSATAAPPPDAATDREDVERICAHLAERIEANGSRRPAVTAKWRTAARLMLDADKRTEDDVHAAIDWSQNHEFWRSNILSLPKLREKYDQLKLQAERQSRASPPRNTGPDWAAAMARAEARDAAAEGRAPEYQPDDDLPLWKALPA